MPFIVKYNKKEYDPAPEGLHSAVCCDVIDKGDVTTQFGTKHKVELRWLTEEVNEKTGKPFMVIRQYNVSLHEKAALRLMLESWRGRKFTKEELEGFDLESVIAANCTLMVAHNITDDGTVYANIQAVGKAAKNGVKLRVNGYVRESEREKREELEHQGNGFQATNDDVPF